VEETGQHTPKSEKHPLRSVATEPQRPRHTRTDAAGAAIASLNGKNLQNSMLQNSVTVSIEQTVYIDNAGLMRNRLAPVHRWDTRGCLEPHSQSVRCVLHYFRASPPSR